MIRTYSNLIFLLAVVCLCTYCSYEKIEDDTGGGGGGGGTNKFKLTLGTAGNNEEGRAAIQTADGGYLILANNLDCSSGGCLWLYKLKPDGSEDWTKNFSYNNLSPCYGYAVKEISGGGYVVAGYIKSGAEQDAFAMKIDNAGNINWQGKYDYGSTGRDEILYDVVPNTDGGFTFSGFYENTNNERLVFSLKTNATGDISWKKLTGLKGAGRSIVQLGNGSYTILSDAPYDSVKLINISNSSGTVMSSKSIGSDLNVCYAMILTSDGGYAVTGEKGFDQYTDITVLKADAGFNFKWETTFADDAQFDGGEALTQSSGGDYGIVGNRNLNGHIYLIRTNSSGGQKFLLDMGTGDGFGIDACTDDGFIMTGKDGSGGIVVYKTDKDGNYQ